MNAVHAAQRQGSGGGWFGERRGCQHRESERGSLRSRNKQFPRRGPMCYARLYHSVALLLPDATVWLAGGNPARGSYEPHIEIYQPAYLFQSDGTLATRPTITSAPASISYGNPFTVQTPDAASIASAVLIRNGTVTHAFGMDQRMVGMSFTAGSGSLTVTAPPNGNIAPPGYYMLFILNSNGVPSMASSVLLSSSSTPAPTVTSISPNSGTINGGTGVTITGTGFLAGATVSLGGTAGHGCDGGEQHVDHSHTLPARGRSRKRDRDQQRYPERNVDPGIHLHGSIQSGTDGDRDFACLGNCRRRYSGDHHRHRIPGGSDGEPGRNSQPRV